VVTERRPARVRGDVEAAALGRLRLGQEGVRILLGAEYLGALRAGRIGQNAFLPGEWWSGRGLTHDGAPEGCQTDRTAASATAVPSGLSSRNGALARARPARQDGARAAEGETPTPDCRGLETRVSMLPTCA
jgi:hypothetical protein